MPIAARLLSFIALLIVGAGLSACTGTHFSLLPAGSGPGRYEGTLRTPAGASAGTFTLRIDDDGRAHGSGTLGPFDVDLRGVLRSDGHLAAFITDFASQETGPFDGTVSGAGAGGAQTTLSGTWELAPPGATPMHGGWEAVLAP